MTVSKQQLTTYHKQTGDYHMKTVNPVRRISIILISIALFVLVMGMACDNGTDVIDTADSVVSGVNEVTNTLQALDQFNNQVFGSDGTTPQCIYTYRDGHTELKDC
jgi:hypothetical protein